MRRARAVVVLVVLVVLVLVVLVVVVLVVVVQRRSSLRPVNACAFFRVVNLLGYGVRQSMPVFSRKILRLNFSEIWENFLMTRRRGTLRIFSTGGLNVSCRETPARTPTVAHGVSLRERRKTVHRRT